MINIKLDNLGKKFHREWIFRNLSAEISTGDKLVILGGNGSGKSTLLQVISGFVTPNEGGLSYIHAQKESGVFINIEAEKIKNNISFASPYIQLVEDFTATELVEHIQLFKPFIKNKPAEEILEICQLSHTKNKYIRHFSSGMKQRLKLGLAILAKTPVVLLDEPLSNLDKKAAQWYSELVADYTVDRTVIVCSNAIQEEYAFCTTEINVMNYKKS